jgi:O-antigen/teichoic acid export membrane protein
MNWPRDWLGRFARDARLQALADQAVVSGCNFATTVIVARELSVQSFGFFSLAAVTCLFLSNLHRAGLTQPMNVLGAGEDRESIGRRLAGLLRLHLLLIPASAAVMAGASIFLFPDIVLAASAIVYLASSALQETLRRYWYTRSSIKDAFTNDLLSYGGQLVLLMLLSGTELLRADTAFMAMGATSVLAFVAGVRRIGPAAFTPAMSVRALLVEYWPMAKWLLLTVLAVWGAGQVYSVLLAPLGVAAVATFAACKNLLNVMGLVVQSVANYVPIHAARTLRIAGSSALRREMTRTCLLALVGGTVFLLVVHWFAEPLLHLLYAGRYDDAADVLRMLAFATVTTLFGVIFGSYAMAMEDSRTGFLSNVAASVTTFTLGVWLIEEHGMWGAAAGNAISSATAMSILGSVVISRLRRPS